MDNLLAFRLEEIPFVVISLVIAFTVHEFAHAYVAYKFGDDTAKRQGRLTLNPVSHIDPLGALFILILGFGWAKPVQVNRFHFKRPRVASVLVSIAGPISNLLVALIGMIFYYAIFKFSVAALQIPFLLDLLEMLVHLNVVLFVFNLLPIPPLDGYRIIEELVPTKIKVKMHELEKFAVLILLIIVLTPLDQYTIQPIFQTVIPAVYNVLMNIANIII